MRVLRKSFHRPLYSQKSRRRAGRTTAGHGRGGFSRDGTEQTAPGAPERAATSGSCEKMHVFCSWRSFLSLNSSSHGPKRSIWRTFSSKTPLSAPKTSAKRPPTANFLQFFAPRLRATSKRAAHPAIPGTPPLTCRPRPPCKRHQRRAVIAKRKLLQLLRQNGQTRAVRPTHETRRRSNAYTLTKPQPHAAPTPHATIF